MKCRRLRMRSASALALVALCAGLPGVDVARATEAGPASRTTAPGVAAETRASAPGRPGRFNPATPRQVRDANGVAVPAEMSAAVTETVAVTGRHGIPGSGVAAVTLLVTTSGAAHPGAVALAAPGRLSGASAVATFERADESTQQVLVPLDSSGHLSLVASTGVSVVLHVVGWVGTATTTPDVAVLDEGVVVLDGKGKRSRLTAARSKVARVGAKADLPRGVRFALAQVTLHNGARSTSLEARAFGTAAKRRPTVSAGRRTRTSQQVLVPLDTRGRAMLDLARGTAHVRLVVLAYLTTHPGRADAPGLQGAPRLRRVLDSRDGGVGPRREHVFGISGRRGVPAQAASVSATVTLLGARRNGGVVRLGPNGVQHGSSLPRVTVDAGEVRSVFLTLPVGADRSWALTRTRGVQVVVDVAGWSVDPVNDVRPPDLSRMTPVTRSADAMLARQVLVTSSRYAMGTWFDDVLPGLLRVDLTKGPPVLLSRSSRSIKDDPTADPGRRLVNIALGLATTVAADAWDADLIGVSEAVGIRRAVGLIDHVSQGHQAFVAGGWGGGWQGSLIGGYLGRAAWLLWDEVPAATRARVVRIIEKEATEAAGEPMVHLRDEQGVHTGRPGDSRSEELSWQVLPTQLALAMFPDSDQRAIWSYAAIQAALTSWARPADVARAEPVHGLPLSSWLPGSNVEDDGTVINHDRVAPEYMALISQTMDQVWLQTLVGEAAPRAATLLVAPVYDALLTRTFDPAEHAAPGGTVYPPGEASIYYPQGSDWGTGIRLRFAVIDAQAQAYGLADPEVSGAFLRLHLEAAAAMQDRFDDGRTYGSWSEFTYVGREEMLAQEAATLVLTLDVRDAGTASFSDLAPGTY